MLPDDPVLKREVAELFLRLLQDVSIKELGYFGDIPRNVLHEGKTTTIKRGDGTEDVTDMRPVTTELTIPLRALEEMDIEFVLQEIVKAGKGMAESQHQVIIDCINKTTEKYGMTTDAKGKKLSLDLFFEALEKLEWTCDENGNLRMPDIVTGSSAYKSFTEMFSAHEEELKERLNDLLNRKKRAWHEAEADRKLVG